LKSRINIPPLDFFDWSGGKYLYWRLTDSGNPLLEEVYCFCGYSVSWNSDTHKINIPSLGFQNQYTSTEYSQYQCTQALTLENYSSSRVLLKFNRSFGWELVVLHIILLKKYCDFVC
jgi:hypothetical protein